MRALAPGTVSLVVLSACAVAPAPLTQEQTAQRIEADRELLEAGRPPLDAPLTLHGAMARALMHNLDARVQAMERAIAAGRLEVDRFRLLPGVSGRFGVQTRSNTRASSSQDIDTGLESLRASTSSDDTTRTGSLSVVWHTLDFGVSYFAAKQQTDRVLIARERRRKAQHELVSEVRRAWWRAVAAERVLTGVGALEGRVQSALADSARIADMQAQSPLEALRYQHALLLAIQELEAQRHEWRIAKLELAALIGLPPGTGYALAMPAPGSLETVRAPTLSAGVLETHALAWRPELREAQLDARIAAGEVKKAMLRILPGLELDAGIRHDSTSFLVNNDWLALGAGVALNLTEIFTAPASIALARAHGGLADARRLALSMAVLTQLYVALASFDEAGRQHRIASRIADTDERIAALLRSGGRLGVVDELRLLQGELEALRSALRRDLRFAEAEHSFGRIFVAAGADLVGDDSAASTPERVAAAIAAAEDGWMRGEILTQP